MSASSYPAGYDALSDPTGSDPLDSLTVPHADQHADANSAIEAIQATLGLNPQGTFSTLVERIETANATADVLIAAAADIDADTATATAAASTATTQAGVATAAADTATTQAGVATTAANNALGALDEFDDRYLGAKAVAPVTDNDGDPLQAGALYFDTVTDTMMVWTGIAWVNAADSVNFTPPLVVSGDSADPILRVTQIGSGPAFVVEDEAHPDATPFQIDSSGNVTTSGTVEAVSPGKFTGLGAVTLCTSSTRPTPSEGMVIYETDTNLFYGYNGTSWASIGGGATGGSTDAVFWENDQTITANYTITTGANAGTFGPVTINSGVTVTVPSGSTWSVV